MRNHLDFSDLKLRRFVPRPQPRQARLFSSSSASAIIVGLSMAVGCNDAIAPSDPKRLPVPERFRSDGFGAPPSAFSGFLDISPNSYLVLPTFSYTTWVEFSVTGAVTLESLLGSRTTYNGPVYPRGVWSQDSNCGLRVSIVYAAASIDAKQTCEQGSTSFVDTIPIKGSGTARAWAHAIRNDRCGVFRRSIVIASAGARKL